MSYLQVADPDAHPCPDTIDPVSGVTILAPKVGIDAFRQCAKYTYRGMYRRYNQVRA